MKKGDLSFETVVIAILALIVLITLIIIYHRQIGDLFGSIGNLVKSTSSMTKDIKLK